MRARSQSNETEVTRLNGKRGAILVSLLAMAAVLASSSIMLSARAQDQGTSPDGQPPWMSQLTDDQKAQIQQLIESLRTSGATPQEMRDAVNAKLLEWGIQIPAPPQGSGQ